MISPLVADDCWAERTGRIQATASVVTLNVCFGGEEEEYQVKRKQAVCQNLLTQCPVTSQRNTTKISPFPTGTVDDGQLRTNFGELPKTFPFFPTLTNFNNKNTKDDHSTPITKTRINIVKHKINTFSNDNHDEIVFTLKCLCV